MPAFRAGAARSNVTPALGVSLNGGMADRQATHIHDELHARCLVLDDGRAPLALVVVDSCMIPREIADAARHLAHGHTGLLPERILISATHTHSAPTVAPVFQSLPDEQYADFLVLRIADGLRRAVNNLAPAKIASGSGALASQVFNRRWRMKPGSIPRNPFGGVDSVQMNPPQGSADLVEPAGPTDPEIAVLAVQRPDGTPLALLANYSLHYVGGTKPGDVSADYFGQFAGLVEGRLRVGDDDPPLVAMMSNGTSGNINNVDFRAAAAARPPYSQMRKVSALVAEEVMRIHGELEFRDWVPLGARQSEISLARRLPTRAEVDRARQVLASGEGAELGSLEEIYAFESLMMAEWPADIDVIVQVLRVGDLGIVALPCEVFVETGLAIKAESPLRPSFTISLANGYAGYLPTLEHHQAGGYETWRARSSFLEVGAEARLREAALKLAGELAAITE